MKRSWSLFTILLVLATGCTMRLPRPGQIGIRVKATTRVEVRARPVTVDGRAEVVVPVQGAPVVEFFGIPLENAQDVVFVLDCSGSMDGLAQGRMAQITPSAAPVAPPEQAPGAPPPAINGPPPDPGQPPPPPPADPNQPPPFDPDAPVTTSPAADPVPTTRQMKKIEVAQAELVDALARLPAGTRMNVLFFNSGVDAFAPTMMPLDETSRANLIAFVNDTTATGGTALAPAMRAAFLMNARRVVLLSDGLGNVGGGAEAVLRDAREAMRGGVRIDTIGLGSGQDADLLNTLSNESGGLYQSM